MSTAMSMERMKAGIEQIRNRVPVVTGRGEEATKQALVLPLIDALGYDIWNPTEVSPEFDADFAVRKGSQKERVDLAVLLGGKPRIFVEVKAVGTQLDSHHGQLSRYFNAVPEVSLGILTNGVEYRFFTDTGEPNIMDARPFYTVNLESIDVPFEVLARFHRANFSAELIRDFASELIFTTQLIQLLRDELDLKSREPSEALVRWILGNASFYEGRVTAAVVERFRPLVKNALQTVLKDIVRRSVLAIDQGVTAEPVLEVSEAPPGAAAQGQDADQDDGGRAARNVVTTAEELQALALVQGMAARSGAAARTLFDASAKKVVPVVIEGKDTTGYFGVYINKPSNWFLRVNFDGKTKWVGFDLPVEEARPLFPTGANELSPGAHAPLRFGVSGPDDLVAFEKLISFAMKRMIDERQPS
jgi:hypothetical protein